MKLAKAKKEDIDALGYLAGAVATMRDGGVPPEEEGEDWEDIGHSLMWLLDDDLSPSEQEEALSLCQRCLRHLFKIAEKGSLLRAATNLDAVFMPENKIINPDSDILETHPDIDRGLADTRRLNWLFNPENKDAASTLFANCVDKRSDDFRAAIDEASEQS